MQPDLVDQVLFDEDYGGEVPRKRTTSVSKMDRKDSAVPEEEDDDERPPLVNGLPGQSLSEHVMSRGVSAILCLSFGCGIAALVQCHCVFVLWDIKTLTCFRLYTCPAGVRGRRSSVHISIHHIKQH